MKNDGVPETPLASALATSSLTRAAWVRRRSSSVSRSPSRSELPRVAAQAAGRQLALVGEQDVVHLPERPLRAGGLGGLGGELGPGMHVAERQVAEDVAQIVAPLRQQLADRGLGAPAVGALEVPVLDQRHRCVGRAADVIARGIDVLGEVDQLLGRAPELARPHAGGDSRDQSEDDPGHQRREDRRREDAELGLCQRFAGERAIGDQQRDREADPRDRAGPREPGPGDGELRAPAQQPARSQPGGSRGCPAACR